MSKNGRTSEDKPSTLARRVAGIYLVLSIAWIIGSGRAAAWLAQGQEALAIIETWKGTVFVVVSALIIYLLVKRGTNRLDRSNRLLKESRRQTRSLLDHLPGVALRRRASDWTMEFISEGVRELTGHEWEEFVQRRERSWEDLIHLEDRQRVRTVIDEALRQRRVYTVEYRICCRNGEVRHVWEQGSGALNQDGSSEAVESIIHDVTIEHEAAEALARSERRFHALYDDNPAIYFTLRADGTIISTNRSGCEQLGYEAEELREQSIFDVVHPDDHAVQRRILDTIAHTSGPHRWEVRKVRKDGSEIWVRETARQVDDPESGEPLVLVICEDISESRSLARQLEHEETHDPLTGLLNEREFKRRLALAAEAAVRERTEHTLLYFDLRQFSVVNEACGRDAGDDMLRELVSVWQNQCRGDPLMARTGADEFCLLQRYTPLAAGWRIAERIKNATVAYRFDRTGQRFTVGINIGIACISDAGVNVGDIMSQAASACAAARNLGRDTIHVYDESDSTLDVRRKEIAILQIINRALDDDRFSLVAQPIVPISTASNSGVHYEVLLRLRDNNGTELGPGQMLPVAERFDVEHQIDQWVFSHLIEWLGQSPSRLKDAIWSVNVSGRTIGKADFLEYLITLIKSRKVPAGSLCIEVTETAAIRNFQRARVFMDKLRAVGCLFALDDFGAGMSSFAYLRNLPVDFLKIDGSFIRNINENEVDAVIVQSINSIGHSLGKRTIAEFVENEQIMERLREIGVDFAQGYGVGRPVELEQLRGQFT